MDWQTFGFVAGLIASWSVLLVGMNKSQLDRLGAHLDGRLDDLKGMHQRLADDTLRNERDLAALKTEMARDYIRREDWVRQVTVLDAKTDQWAALFDRKVDEMRKVIHERR